MKGLKLRLSKTFILVMGGIVVLGGGSGAAAVFIGTDQLLGPSYLEINGLECTALQTVKIKKNKQYWIRKYVTSTEPGDGLARVRTAARVARAVQEKEKADLVLVAMIDPAGPTERSGMRGRTIGAQVVYIPDPAKVPEDMSAQIYSAYYLDGAANGKGEFFGLRIDLPVEDVETLTAKLTDHADCIEPVAAEDAAGGHGPAPKGGGHGEASGHGAPAEGHGETPAADAHAAPAEADGHGAPAEGHGEEVAAKEGGGFLSSITGLIFGSEEAVPADAHAEPAAAHGETGEAPAEGHGETVAAAEAPVKDEGFFASVKGMIFGDGQEKPEAAHDEASADAHPAPEPAAEPRTSAEGGKRWSGSGKEDEIRSDHDPAEAAPAEEKAAAPDADTEADAAGAEWLAKLRGEPVPAAKPAH